MVAQGFISDIKNVATKGIDGTFGVLKQVAGDLLDTLRKGANNGLRTAREAIRSYTGLHSPEIPTLLGRIANQNRQNVNLVDAPSYFEKMGLIKGRITADAALGAGMGLIGSLFSGIGAKRKQKYLIS